MNENKKSEEIEVLDGLEDFFELSPNKTKNEEHKQIEEEEEVFSVFDDPEEEVTFSDFKPDKIVEESQPKEFTEVNLKPTIEPVIEPETFSIDEPEETVSNSVPEKEEVPDFPSFNEESLEPIEISSSVPNLNTDEMFQWDMDESEENKEMESLTEEPSVSTDYDYMKEFMTPEPEVTDAFTAQSTDVVEEESDLAVESSTPAALEKTVVIEPVKQKEVQETSEKEDGHVEVVKEEQPKIEKKQKKDKKSGRTILFVVLLGILLLAFVALIPILLEMFAI